MIKKILKQISGKEPKRVIDSGDDYVSDHETPNIFISHNGKLVNQKINILKTLEPSEGKELKFEGLQYNLFQFISGLFLLLCFYL